MTSSLVGSEMCIRDRGVRVQREGGRSVVGREEGRLAKRGQKLGKRGTVSYTHLTLPTICSV
eukprot:7172343-Prorocentrum_lima.AAC.1